MYRIGIIGTENSHAMAFAKLMNGDESGRAKVVAVMGPDDTAQKVAAEAGVESVFTDVNQFLGKVDAIMITCRRGSQHAAYALPFVNAGLPLFIDKPITSDFAEAVALMQAIKKAGVPVCGGSGLKYNDSVIKVKAAAEEMKAKGMLLSASMNYSADTESEYDGLHFYAPHLTEIALSVLGDGVTSVKADVSEGCVLVTARYADLLASLHFTKNSRVSCCTLYGKEGCVMEEIAPSDIYAQEVKHFLEMLDTGTMPQTHAELIKPVQIVSAIVESMKTGLAVDCPAVVI